MTGQNIPCTISSELKATYNTVYVWSDSSNLRKIYWKKILSSVIGKGYTVFYFFLYSYIHLYSFI